MSQSFAGKKPNRTVTVPLEYQRQTLTRERDTLVNDVQVETNCHVDPHLDQGKIKSFDIYGAGSNLNKAVARINEWISNAHTKSRESAAWAKLPAYDANKWHYDRVEEKENESKQRFKGPVPPQGDPDAPRHTIIVDWPAALSEEQLSPRDVWGNKLWKLDPLRMQDNVWITLQSNGHDKWQIEIAGHDIADVEAAKEHFDALLDQVRADHCGVQHAHNVILGEREDMLVKLQKTEEWWPSHDDRVVPRLLPSGMKNEPGRFRKEAIDSKQLSETYAAIESSLDRIRSKKGVYDFAVRLGGIALKSQHVLEEKIGQVYTKETFLKDVNGRIGLDVKKWLANDAVGYSILRRFMSRTDILEPTKSALYFGCMPTSLKETRPTFRGTWVFRDPDSVITQPRAPPRHSGRPVPRESMSGKTENVCPAPTCLFVVVIEWTDDETGMYEKDTPRFYKLEAGRLGPNKNMDVSLLELEESRGWHFALESLPSTSSKTVPTILTGFAGRVQMKPKYDISSTGPFAEFDATPTVKKHLQTSRLDSMYRFGIKDTCYKAELTAMWYSQQKLPVWGLAVRHIEWETHLSEQEHLSIGHCTDWGDTMATFFPEAGKSSRADDSEDLDMGTLNLDIAPAPAPTARDGLGVLVEKLLKLSEIVSSVTNEGGVGL